MRRLVLVMLFAAAPARAQVDRGVSLQVVAGAGGGYTDNVASAPDNPPPGLRGAESDSFADVAPSLVLAYGGTRSTQRLAYTLFANFYVNHSEANSYSNTLLWQATWETSARTKLATGLSVAGGKFSAFQLNTPSSQTTITQLPPGAFGFVSAAATEGFAYEPTPDWQWSQGAGFVTFQPIDAGQQPKTYSTDLGLGVERSWRSNALAFGVRSNLLVLGNAMATTTANPSNSQLIETATLRWRHDLDVRWSSELGAGTTTILLAHDLGKNATEPWGRAALRYTQRLVSADLAYEHAAMPNIFVAQTFFVDQVTLSASVPFGRSGLALGAGSGYQYARLQTIGNGAGGSAQIFLADGSLSWAAQGSSLGVSLRYVHFQQTASNEMGMTPLTSMSRNLVLLNVSAAYPNQQAGAQPIRSPLRVDKSDVASEP
jgi:hypothetical protein